MEIPRAGRAIIPAFALFLLVVSNSGCHTWPQMGLPFGNPSRVSAPGTGDYQLPQSYYNNTAPAGTGVSSFQPASQPSSLNAQLPGTGGVQTATFTSGVNGTTKSPNNSAPNNAAVMPAGFYSTSGSTAETLPGSSEIPSLQWQK